jgi:hypothetical protein
MDSRPGTSEIEYFSHFKIQAFGLLDKNYIL